MEKLSFETGLFDHEKFSFSTVKEILRLDTRKPTSFNNIPAKILKMNQDISAPPLCIIFNQAVCGTLKKANLIPYHKQNETTESNYLAISILNIRKDFRSTTVPLYE